MCSPISRSTSKFAALTLPLVACLVGASAAHAASPRLLARDVSGVYDMQDGSTLNIDVAGRCVLVESSTPECWKAPDANLLVSPDGLRKIRLLRDFDGRVDRIEMQITSTR